MCESTPAKQAWGPKCRAVYTVHSYPAPQQWHKGPAASSLWQHSIRDASPLPHLDSGPAQGLHSRQHTLIGAWSDRQLQQRALKGMQV